MTARVVKKSKPPAVRRAIFAAAVVACLVLLALLVPSVRQTVKAHGPLHGAYLRYSKWRYHWKAPDDVGSGGSALEALIEDPMGIGEDASGNLYVSDRGNRFIWKIDAAGRATVIAGSGMGGNPADGVAATASKLSSPEGLVVDRAGDVIFVDSYANVVMKIDRAGTLHHVAGTGRVGFGGDGGPARAATFAHPYDVRLDSQGNLYVADFNNNRIRRIDPNGIITTVAGTGAAGYDGDGGPAAQARLNGPYGVFVDAGDRLLIADSQNHVIRRIDPNGIITTIAGSGRQGYAGDDGPALNAEFNTPQSLFVDAQGRLLIGDEHNHCIRLVERDGTVRTLIGKGRPGYAGDGQAAAVAELNDPENIWIRRDGMILITDGDNGRVRSINPQGTVGTVAGRGVSPDHVAQLRPTTRNPLSPLLLTFLRAG